ncbi:dihydroxy-acid dehydratase [Bartonella quintana]|uniref:dihydroxy-acid dehydratase n=1 Tax=Bartonella quintana TaxID=803 RepID=UPI0004B5872B|nr:dihydroxy-acid dehydratase [Bartonella quintana]
MGGYTNQAHGFAACCPIDKKRLKYNIVRNIGIITAYNDILSAYQPFETFPSLIKEACSYGWWCGTSSRWRACDVRWCNTRVCWLDGALLFSREVIAMATAISLSHDMFDVAISRSL